MEKYDKDVKKVWKERLAWFSKLILYLPSGIVRQVKGYEDCVPEILQS